MQKKCTICEQEKSLEEFSKSKTGKYGVDGQCKKCRYQRTGKLHYLNNKKKCHENANKWAKRNREKINETSRIRYDKDPERVLDRLRGYRKNNKNTLKRYRENNKEKINAQSKLRDHVKRGNIIKPSTCSLCGSDKWIEAHHADYTKPLEVVWVCKKCHVAIHKRLESRVQPERPNSQDA